MFGRIYLDTAPIIYYLESNPNYVNIMQNFLIDHYAYGSVFYTSKINAGNVFERVSDLRKFFSEQP